LDNFEHLLPSVGPAVAQWHAVAPHVRLLITSRERLRVRGEQIYEVSPLTYYESDDAIRDLSDAAQLLLDRVRTPSGVNTFLDADTLTLERIARELDGLPLALELAAGRIHVIGAKDVLARLPHRLALLTGGPRDATDRQRTLRGAIHASWELLS